MGKFPSLTPLTYVVVMMHAFRLSVLGVEPRDPTYAKHLFYCEGLFYTQVSDPVFLPSVNYFFHLLKLYMCIYNILLRMKVAGENQCFINDTY